MCNKYGFKDPVRYQIVSETSASGVNLAPEFTSIPSEFAYAVLITAIF